MGFAIRVHGALGGGQRLAQHLAAEHEMRADIPALAAEQVVLQTLEFEQVDEFADVVFRHGRTKLGRSGRQL